ncbi:E3 ubiquitin-protein ligase RNF103 [Antennarius striatus]|uniref:E3 ubiquitin-protein ligase RNF103 n=1 Tax=Antennarius striatus TaxID=241820 RepID=UPI0035AE394A
MWLKLCFLLLYLVVLFMLARVFEAVVWYETGTFSTQLVDPVTLSYKKLRTILERRGLGPPGLGHKEDVSELVEKSGELTQGELYSAIRTEEQTEAADATTSHFSGELHFYELVEDTKDGIWLVQVIGKEQEALISQSHWRKIVQRMSQFGIRTGTFNCSHDHRSCMKRGWTRSTLVMSVPQTSASKGKVMLKEYSGRHTEAEHILRWMTSHVAHRIKTLRHSEQLLEEWRSDQTRPLKMFLFTRLAQPPAFFSALSIKFTGRIDFIYVDVRHWDNHSILAQIGVTHSPAYILKMPEGIYRYGNRTGEFLTLVAMDTFLRSVQPEVNDLFVLSLVLINLMAWMDLFITQGATVKRFVVLIRTLGTYNSVLLVTWLPVLALLQLPYLDSLYGYSLKLLRYADTTTLASLVRADWTFYSSHPALLLSTYLAHGLLVDYFEKKRRCGIRSQEDNTTNLEWLASLWDWYISCLLHPITSLQQFPFDHSDWEEDANFLVERLAFPDLWLRPLINMDYIKALPTWTFRAPGQDLSEGSGPLLEDKTDSDSSSRQKTDSPHAGPSRQSSTCKRPKRPHCKHNSSSQVCVSTNLEPAAEAPSYSGHENGMFPPAGGACCLGPEGAPDQQHCGGSACPRDVLQCSECVVCLENFVAEELLMSLPCGHVFHQQCIVVWLAAGRHCCPVCRWPSYKKKQKKAPQSSSTQSSQQDASTNPLGSPPLTVTISELSGR